MEEVGLWKMKEYIWSRQDTILEYISNCLIYEICTGAEQVQGSIRLLRWWDHYLTREEEGNGTSEGAEREVGQHMDFLV